MQYNEAYLVFGNGAFSWIKWILECRLLFQIILNKLIMLNEFKELTLHSTEEAISKTARVLEEADISEEKRDVIHREIGKFRESMKVTSHPRSLPPPLPLM